MLYNYDDKKNLAPSNARSASASIAQQRGVPVLNNEAFGRWRGRRLPPPQVGEVVPFNGLLTNKILTALPGEDFTRLLPHLEPVSLACTKDGNSLDDGRRFVYFPETVVFSQFFWLEDGSTTETALIGKEGLAGLSALFSSRQTPARTQVTIAGNALRIRTDLLKQEFARGESLQQLLFDYASACLTQLAQRAVCNNRHSMESRFCSWLLMLRDCAASDELPLTHETMAQHLGVRRAGITNIANSLRHAESINYSRARLHILDATALGTAACECYAAVKKTFASSMT
jgi:CRP-like cAMP-binding protein